MQVTGLPYILCKSQAYLIYYASHRPTLYNNNNNNNDNNTNLYQYKTKHMGTKRDTK